MASSTALALVNKVLRMTGSFKQLAAISGSVGGIGERIVEMLNLTLADVESKANWPELRVNATGTGDGVEDVFEYAGADDVRVGSPISVWIEGHQILKELTPTQFDEVIASDELSGMRPQYYQRQTAISGKAQVQIYPVPASGDVINVSAYKRATRLDAATPTGTTEFDDDILVYGACMHMDAYDQINRGYSTAFQNLLSQMLLQHYSNRDVGMFVEDYR